MSTETDAIDDRVLRGGSWYSDQDDARASYRGSDSPGIRDFNIGFRLVLRRRYEHRT